MAFTPITSDQDISYAYNHSHFRNANREVQWGTPVYFTPSTWAYDLTGGYGGPKYDYGYNYNNSTSTSLGGCTWWCAGRSEEANGKYLGKLGNGANWYANYTGNKSTTLSNLQAGDIICFSDNTIYGHVMFVEQISGSTVTISQSADSTRSLWSGKSCTVETYSLSSLAVGSSVNMYASHGASHSVTVVGYLHTGGGSTGTYTLSYGTEPDGAGYFTGSEEGEYTAGESITITAHANSGYVFQQLVNEQGDVYTDPSITRTMNRDRTYTAYFIADDSQEIIACTMTIKKKKGQINEITILV